MTKPKDFEWIEFFKLADSYTYSNSQAKIRTGISRFYYSAFCKSRNYINSHELYLDNRSEKIMTSKKVDVHAETSKIFRNHEKFCNDCSGVIISKNLDKLRKMRNQADYDNVINRPLDKMIQESKKRSKRIFELLNQLN